MGKVIKALFSVLVITPVIFLTIALVLILLPVNSKPGDKTLDFDSYEFPKANAEDAKLEQFRGRDGEVLSYRHIKASSSRFLILYHGSGTEARYLVNFAKALSKANINVVLPDLRGHGLSQQSYQGDVAYLGQLDDDYIDLVTHIKSQAVIDQLILGGHSSGGGFVLRPVMAESADGLILLSPYLGHQSPTVRENSGGWVTVASLRYAGLAMLNGIGINILNSRPVLYFHRPAELEDGLQQTSYSFRLNESFAPPNYQNLSIKKPALVIVGERDEAFFVDKFPEVLKLSVYPNIEFKLVAGATHLNVLDQASSLAFSRRWLKAQAASQSH